MPGEFDLKKAWHDDVFPCVLFALEVGTLIAAPLGGLPIATHPCKGMRKKKQLGRRWTGFVGVFSLDFRLKDGRDFLLF